MSKTEDFKYFLNTLDVMNELAESLWAQDEPVRACLTECQIWESSKKVLGEKHECTLNAMHNYALGLAKCGRNEEAAEILNKYLELTEKDLYH